MREIICGCSEDYTPEQFNKLEDYAASLGVTLRNIPYNSTDTALTEDCEILFGGYEDCMIEAAKALKWFQSSWDGADGLVGLGPIRSGQAILTNAAGAYDTMIAEYLIGGCSSLLHRFPDYGKAQAGKVWADCMPAESFSGKKVLILGCGRIGNAFAVRANALGAEVIGVTRTKKQAPDYIREMRTLDQLDELLPKADILVMLLPLAKDNKFVMDERRLRLMKKSAYVLNAGRGKTLDAAALCEKLRRGEIAGAMLDVFPEEPIKSGDETFETPGLIVTPHIAGHSADAFNMENIMEIFKKNLKAYVEGKELSHVIDISKGY